MSFSAEMKDFLGAWEKGNKILGARTDEEYKKAQTEHLRTKTAADYDPERLKLQDEQARANLVKTGAGTALINEQVKNAGVSRGYTAALTDRIKKADQDIGGYSTGNLPPGMVAAPGPAVGPAAAPTAPTGPVLQPREDLYGYEEGGVIPDTGVDDDDDSVGPGAAIPDTPTSSATDFSAARRGGGASQLPQAGYQGVISPLLVSDAVRGGYQYGIKSLGLGGRGTGAKAKQQAMALAQGQDALSPQEMELARKAVDPEGRLTDSQRNMAALGSVYQHWANKGDPARAQKVAFQMLQHFRLASQRYAAIAAAAAEQGNMDVATKAALKAYSNVPDGRDMQISVGQDGKLTYVYTDENGKTLKKGIASPQEFAAAAMGLARGGFDQAILSAAGAREAAEGGRGATAGGRAPKGEAAVGGDKVSDMKGRNEMMDPEVQKLQEKWQKKNEGKEIDDAYWGNLRDSATHIMQQNPNVTAREALATSQALADPKNNDYKTVSEGGKNTIKFKDGQKIVLDDDAFDVLITRRAEARRAQMASEDKAKEDAKKPSRMDAAIGGAKRIGGAVSNIASEAGEAAKAGVEAIGGGIKRALPDELRERVGSDIAKAGTLADSVADRFRNKGAIPESTDSPL